MGIPTFKLFQNICRRFKHLYWVNTRNTSILLRDVCVCSVAVKVNNSACC